MGMYIAMYVLLLPGVAWFVNIKSKLGSDNPKSVAIKAACTLVIVLAAIVTAAGASDLARIYAILITAGLVCGLIGDVVISQKASGGFFFGMVYFAIGHLCYIGAFLNFSNHILWSLPVFIIIYLLLIFVVQKLHIKLGTLLLPTIVYSLVITAMVSLAVTMPFSVKYGFLVSLGGILFAISDALLAYGVFKENSNEGRKDFFGLYCYYIGQSCFALSICVLYV